MNRDTEVKAFTCNRGKIKCSYSSEHWAARVPSFPALLLQGQEAYYVWNISGIPHAATPESKYLKITVKLTGWH